MYLSNSVPAVKLLLFFSLFAHSAPQRILEVCEKLESDPKYGTKPGEVCQCEGKHRITRKIDKNDSCITCADMYRFDPYLMECTLCGQDENCGESVRDTCRKCLAKDLKERRRNRNFTDPTPTFLTTFISKITKPDLVQSTTQSPPVPAVTAEVFPAPKATSHVYKTGNVPEKNTTTIFDDTSTLTAESPGNQNKSVIGLVCFILLGIYLVCMIGVVIAKCRRTSRRKMMNRVKGFLLKNKRQEVRDDEVNEEMLKDQEYV